MRCFSKKSAAGEKCWYLVGETTLRQNLFFVQKLNLGHSTKVTPATLKSYFWCFLFPKIQISDLISCYQKLDFCHSVKIIFFKHWRKVLKMSNNAIDVKNCKYHPLAYTQFALNAFYYQIRWLRLTQGFFIRVFWKPRPEPQILFNISFKPAKRQKEWKNSIPTSYEMKSWF